MEKTLLSRIELGRRSEEVAVDWLKQQGYEITCRNFRTRFGEVDVVARKGDHVIIGEVRSRNWKRRSNINAFGEISDDVSGEVLSSVGSAKRHRIFQSGMSFLRLRRLDHLSVEILIIAVNWYNSTWPCIHSVALEWEDAEG